jgi:hypothetical protein
LDKLNNFGLSSFYVNWFQSYLSNIASFGRILGKFFPPFSVLSGVPPGSTFRPLLFSIFINDLSAKINHSKFLLFADDLKMCRNIKSALQVDINAVQQWCGENCMELNIQKTKIISLTRKTNSIHFKYFVKDVLNLRAEYIKDLGVILDSKLYFHCHVDFVYSQALRTLGLIRFITYNFSSLGSLVVLCLALIRSTLESAFAVWNKLTSSDSNNKEKKINKENLPFRFITVFFNLACST